MARVVAFQVSGLDLMIRTGDHDPPHIHVMPHDGAWHIKMHLLTTHEDAPDWLIHANGRWTRPDAAGRVRGPTGKQLRRLTSQVVANREALLEEWEAAQGGRR